MKYVTVVFAAFLVILCGCNSDTAGNSNTKDSLQPLAGEARYNIFPFKAGTKFHYNGIVTTDSSNDYPTDKPFSEGEYNKEIAISDLVITVDTVIAVDDFVFARFLFSPNQPSIDSSSADFNFIFSSEPFNAFNLVFYKNEIYTIEPSMDIYNTQLTRLSPNDNNYTFKMDSALHSIYSNFYKQTVTSGGCLQQMLHNRVLLADGRDSMHIIGNGEGCNFHIRPFLMTTSVNSFNKYPTFGSYFYDFAGYDSLPGEFGGKTKMYRDLPNDFYISDSTTYYYSTTNFISKVVRNFKWNRTMHGQMRSGPPTRYTLSLYKIED